MTKRAAIIQATINVVAENGFADSPTIKIARRAGAAEFTLFRLFTNKEELLHETFEEGLRRIQEHSRAAVNKSKDCEQGFIAHQKIAIKYFRKYPEELAFLQQYFNSSIAIKRRPDLRYEQGEDMTSFPLISLLGDGRKQGIIKKLSMPVLIGLTVSPLIIFLRDEQMRKIKHKKSECELFVEACWDAIRA